MRIVFVCTGNTCRSSMAEGLAKQWLLHNARHRNDIEVVSAGIAAIKGSAASPNAIEVMADIGIDISFHKARPFSAELAENSEYILTMTSGHKQVLIHMFPFIKGKVFTLAEFSGVGGEDVSDPFGQSADVYRQCAGEISKMIELALQKILTDPGADFINGLRGK